jgi:hypothetical protein
MKKMRILLVSEGQKRDCPNKGFKRNLRTFIPLFSSLLKTKVRSFPLAPISFSRKTHLSNHNLWFSSPKQHAFIILKTPWDMESNKPQFSYSSHFLAEISLLQPMLLFQSSSSSWEDVNLSLSESYHQFGLGLVVQKIKVRDSTLTILWNSLFNFKSLISTID